MRRTSLLVLATVGLAAFAPTASAGAQADVTPPTISVTSPLRIEVVNTDVTAQWTCDDEPGGSGIAECSADVALGSSLPTHQAGPHQLTITARDNAGNVTVRTRDYHVVPSLECNGEPVTVFTVLGQLPTTGDDVILGTGAYDEGDGGDTINARGGDDVVCAGQGPDSIRGGGGDDLIFAHSGQDVVLGGAGRDTVYGGVEADYLDGGIGNDRLLGELGADRLLGGDGADRLLGGGNLDHCWGGDGRDRGFSCAVRRGLP